MRYLHHTYQEHEYYMLNNFATCVWLISTKSTEKMEQNTGEEKDGATS